MDNIQIIFTGIATVIGAITTFFVRSRFLNKRKEEALTLPNAKRLSFFLSMGEKLPIDRVEKMSNDEYTKLVNKIYDQKNTTEKRVFSFLTFLVIVILFVFVRKENYCENLTNLKEEIVLFKRDLENTNKNLEISKSQEQNLDKKGEIGKRQIIIEANIRKCESILLPRLSREIDKCNSGNDNQNEYKAVYNEFQQLKTTAN